MNNYKSPIYFIETLGNAKLYIKREDLLPFSFGGNKMRIAQEYFADMESKGKNCMVGYGNARSNMCRVLANMAYVKKIPCHIISPADDDGTRKETANSAIVKSCGATIHPCLKTGVSTVVREVLENCKNDGLNPYYIYGDEYGKGNEAVPVRAYAKVYDEIKEQSQAMGFSFDYIFLATGTGMTQAGLVAGRQLRHGKEKIIGISVGRNRAKEIKVLEEFFNAYVQEQGGTSNEIGQLDILDEYLCGGYGQYDTRIARSIGFAMKNFGFSLDPTYTGKAFWGMLDYMQKCTLSGNVLFIHTGGTPLFFDNVRELLL